MRKRIELEEISRTMEVSCAVAYVLQRVSRRPTEQAYQSLFRIGLTSVRNISREREIVELRRACVFWIRELFGDRFSFPVIAKAVGYARHTSAIHAYKKYALRIDKIIAEGASDGEGGRRYLRETIE